MWSHHNIKVTWDAGPTKSRAVREPLTRTACLDQARWSPLAWAISQEVLIRNTVLPPKANQENSAGAKGETPVHMSYQPSRIPVAGIHLGCEMPPPPGRILSQIKYGPSKVIGQRQLETNKHHYHKTWDCEPHGRAVLLGSLTLLLSTRVPLPNKVSCFVSMCVSSDNSFPSVRQEVSLPATEPTWKVIQSYPDLQRTLYKG